MLSDIGGWGLSCDAMFRRFGTPFAVDWLAKNVNGYLYTAAVPADPDLVVPSTEYGHRYWARVPANAEYAQKIGSYLATLLPVSRHPSPHRSPDPPGPPAPPHLTL